MKIVYRYHDLNRKDKIKEIIKPIMSKNLIIIGIGTDLLTGDCLGPLVGQFVKEQTDLEVLGYFGNLVTAINVAQVQASLDKSKYVLAIDASISINSAEYVEDIIYRDRGLKPGSGIQRDFPRTGTHSLTGIVRISQKELSTNQFMDSNIRLGMVYSMARTISEAIIECYKEVVVDNQK